MNNLLTKTATIKQLNSDFKKQAGQIMDLKKSLEINNQSIINTNNKEDSIVKIERCKILAENYARTNSLKSFHKAAEDAIARGDSETAAVYLTADPKKSAGYQPDYEQSYYDCLIK